MTTFAERPTTSVTADGMLALAHLAGDDHGFTTLFRRYHPDVLRVVRASVRDHALAEDLAQEAMTRALRYLHTYDPTQPFWPWIRKIACTVVASEMGKRAAEVPVGEIRAEPVLPDTADRVVTRDLVESCLDVLPKRQRRALVLRYVDDRDPNDIAAMFGLSRNALEQLLLRGRIGLGKEYRARNASLLPGFGAVVARLRRLVAGFEARWQGATNATMSVASDVAIAAALTFGGVGLASIGGGAEAPPNHLADPAPRVERREPRDIATARPEKPADRAPDLASVARVAHDAAARTRGEVAPAARPTAAPWLDGTAGDDVPGNAAGDPSGHTDGGLEGKRPADPVPEAPEPAPPVPTGDGTWITPETTDPVPEPPQPSTWVGKENSGASIEEDDVTDTSAEASAGDPTKDGSWSNHTLYSEVDDVVTTSGGGGTSNKPGDSLACLWLELCQL